MDVDGGKEAEQGPAVKVDSPELGKNLYFLMDCSFNLYVWSEMCWSNCSMV